MRTIYYNGAPIGELPSTGNDQADIAATREFLKARGLWKKPSKKQQMYGAAVGFEKTAAMLYGELQQRHAKPGWKGHDMVPFIVNTAFSIELLLKTIGEHHGKAPWGHDLLEVYRKLPATAKRDIDEGKATVPPDRFSPAAIRKTFPELLRPIAKAFEKWRYMWELADGDGMFHIDDALACQFVLHEVATKLLYPDWPGSYRVDGPLAG